MQYSFLPYFEQKRTLKFNILNTLYHMPNEMKVPTTLSFNLILTSLSRILGYVFKKMLGPTDYKKTRFNCINIHEISVLYSQPC